MSAPSSNSTAVDFATDAHRGMTTSAVAHAPVGGMSSATARRYHGNRRDAGTSAECALDIITMRRAWLLRNHPYVQTCTNNILKDMFNGEGIVMLRGNERIDMSDALKAYMHRHMERFARDFFMAKQAFGVVPITFEYVDSNDGLGPASLVPFVPTFGTYVITTRTVRGRQYFHFYWSHIDLCLLDAAIDHGISSATFSSTCMSPLGTRDDSVIVAHGFGYDPDISGRLVSNFSSILHHLTSLATLSQCAVTAQRISCKPPIVSQYNPVLEIAAEKNHKQGYYVGDTSTDEARQEVAFSRDAREIESWKRTMRAMNETNGTGAADFGVSSLGTETVGRYSTGDDTDTMQPAHIMLSSTRQLVHQQQPTTRNDLVQLGEQAMEIVCSVLSMPHCSMAARSGVRAGVESVDDQMARTVVKEADELSRVMTLVYNHMFGEADVYDELCALVEVKRRRISLKDAERRQRNGTLMGVSSMLSGNHLPPSFVPARTLVTEEDLYAVDMRTRRRLAFDLPPATTQNNMHLLYARGIIDWRTYNESLLRMNNLPRSMAANARDPWSADERKTMAVSQRGGGGGGGDGGDSRDNKDSDATKKKSPSSLTTNSKK